METMAACSCLATMRCPSQGIVSCHAYWLSDGMFTVNGIDVGEIGMESLIAGQMASPCFWLPWIWRRKRKPWLSPQTPAAP